MADIGERALVQQIMKYLTPMPGMPIPFWDDASGINLGDGRVLVINTDMLVWETDIPVGMNPFQAGRKAVVMNISDLGAKGVQPIAFMPNLAVPSDYPVANVIEMAKGFESGVREYDAYVIGGDTNEACDVIISGSAFGFLEGKKIMRRSGGAKPGDILAVTGTFGLTSIGFLHLLDGIELPTEVKSAALESIYMPRARVKEGIALANTGVITSCMDSSDGLSVSLYDLRRSMGYGFIVDQLPIHPLVSKFVERRGIDPVSVTMNGGEEYELVFTYTPEKETRIKSALNAVGCNFIKIGEVSERKDIVYQQNEVIRSIRKGGWDHFREPA